MRSVATGLLCWTPAVAVTEASHEVGRSAVGSQVKRSVCYQLVPTVHSVWTLGSQGQGLRAGLTTPP